MRLTDNTNLTGYDGFIPRDYYAVKIDNNTFTIYKDQDATDLCTYMSYSTNQYFGIVIVDSQIKMKEKDDIKNVVVEFYPSIYNNIEDIRLGLYNINQTHYAKIHKIEIIDDYIYIMSGKKVSDHLITRFED